MIHAYFETTAGAIPLLSPECESDELMEIARLCNMTHEDLFRLDIPGGASRPARFRGIMRQSDYNTLMSSTGALGEGSALLKLDHSGSGVSVFNIAMSILPPKPMFYPVASGFLNAGTGLLVVEAVDARYWWARKQVNAVNLIQMMAQNRSSDGRNLTSGVSSTTTPLQLLNTLKSVLVGLGTINTAAYTPNPKLLSRVANHVFTPECSIPMAIDLLLSATGYVLIHQTGTTYVIKKIESDTDLINSRMVSGVLRAVAGGLEPTSGTDSSGEPLLNRWTFPTGQLNRMPSSATVSFPYRTVEARTYYNNAADVVSGELQYQTMREVGYEREITTTQDRPSYQECALVLKEPRALIANQAPESFDPLNPNLATFNTPQPPAWNYTTGSGTADANPPYDDAVIENLVNRCQMSIGRVTWGGWVAFPPVGAYRGTLLRYTFGVRERRFVPIMITECDEKDWIFGPDGLQPTDPRDIVMSLGKVHARRLGSGVLSIEVAPPDTRVFAARITGANRMGVSGDEYWRWVYTFEEDEPNPATLYSPMTVTTPNYRRSGYARNMSENGNNFVAANNPANLVAPGVLQSDYPTSVIDALPISTGTVVMMCEQYPAATYNEGVGPFARQYWFSTPNAVKVTCI